MSARPLLLGYPKISLEAKPEVGYEFYFSSEKQAYFCQTWSLEADGLTPAQRIRCYKMQPERFRCSQRFVFTSKDGSHRLHFECLEAINGVVRVLSVYNGRCSPAGRYVLPMSL